MSANKTAAVHALFRAAILGGFAVYIVLLAKNGSLQYYIAPRMVIGVKSAALGLYIIAVIQAYQSAAGLFGKLPTYECGHDRKELSASFAKHAWIYSLFILPLFLGFALPDAALGSALAAKKGMNLNSASSIRQEIAAPAPDGASAETLFPADKYKLPYARYAGELYRENAISVTDGLYIETLATLQMYLDRFIGKPIELTGFVYRDEPTNGKQFIAGRFAVQCCSADAAPYGVLVDYGKAQTLKDDTWVKINGTVTKTDFNGTDLLTVKASDVEKIPEPKTSYVYPNAEFGK